MPNIERLRILSKGLRERVKPEEFDMAAWHCGMPEFSGLLRLVPIKPIPECPFVIPLSDAVPVFCDEFGRETRSWDAVERFFEIGAVAALKLFSSGSYNSPTTPSNVADRIDAFIAEHKSRAACSSVAE